MVAGLLLSTPQPYSTMPDDTASTGAAADGETQTGGEDTVVQSADSRDLPVLVAPLISGDGEIVGYQSLALSVVMVETPAARTLRMLQLAIEDSFNEWIATSSDDDRREHFDDLFSLADHLESQARDRLAIDLEFDLVALQSDIFAAAETRQNLIEPKGGPAKPGPDGSTDH
ncbi:hypothetical protein [Notoacmeibacter marinus]|uniref:hypothetical protein n=1 Tax=Notoacmeibacter marinus TaxID=1876515 RepID=UPI00111D843E|nr:hypothetical protein [Notoacmeibacter marinus]